MDALFAIDAFWLMTDRILTGAPDYDAESKPFERPALPADLAMFPTSLRHPGSAFTASGVYGKLAGRAASSPDGHTTRHPLIARPDDRGYSPHTLRGAVMQCIEVAAPSYCADRGLSDTPRQIFEALVDHAIPSDPHGYLDRNSLRGRERLSKMGAQIAWEMLATVKGARTHRDHDAYRKALRLRCVLEREVEVNREQKRAARATAGRPGGSLTRLVIDLGALDEAREDLDARRAELERHIERLRNDPNTRIPVPDELPDGELVDCFDVLDREVRHVRTGERERASRPAPIRDPPWTTIREFAYIGGISYPQAARWANGEHLPHRLGDPRRPFEPSNLPVDRSLGPRKRRIAVDGIKPGFFRTDDMRTRLAEVLATWPPQWSESQCHAPLLPGGCPVARRT